MTTRMPHDHSRTLMDATAAGWVGRRASKANENNRQKLRKVLYLQGSWESKRTSHRARSQPSSLHDAFSTLLHSLAFLLPHVAHPQPQAASTAVPAGPPTSSDGSQSKRLRSLNFPASFHPYSHSSHPSQAQPSCVHNLHYSGNCQYNIL